MQVRRKYYYAKLYNLYMYKCFLWFLFTQLYNMCIQYTQHNYSVREVLCSVYINYFFTVYKFSTAST